MRSRRLFTALAEMVDAYKRSVENENKEWEDRWETRMFELVKQHFPHGSGFDIGTQLDFDSSTDEKLVFVTWFHHMHESGMYDGWTEHAVTVTPSLARGFNLRISGRNRNEIKDLIHEYFAFALNLVERETVDGKTVFEDSIGCPVRSVGEMSCQ